MRTAHDSSRWQRLDETTASGKQLFHCSQCGRKSPTCDKTCPRGCGDQASEKPTMTREEALAQIRAVLKDASSFMGANAVDKIATLLVQASQPKLPPAVEENPISLAATRYFDHGKEGPDVGDGLEVSEAWLELFPLGCNQLATPEWLLAAGFAKGDGLTYRAVTGSACVCVVFCSFSRPTLFLGGSAKNNLLWDTRIEATVGNVLLFCRAFQIAIKPQ